MSETTPAAPLNMPGDHFVAATGVSLRYADGVVRGRASLQPSMWAAGTRRPRLAILATLVDVVAGHVPDGPRTPTVDLRVQRTGAVPEEGEIELVARADRVGRKLVVAETIISGLAGRAFARATTTFMNRVMNLRRFDAGVPAGTSIDSFEQLVGARVVDESTLEVIPTPQLSNGRVGTVQGGVQAFLAELAAEQVAGPGAEAVDLAIRFLSRVKRGPLRARADSVGQVGGLESIRVELSDNGDADRMVSTVSLLMARR